MADSAAIDGGTRTPDATPVPVSLITDELDTSEARDRWNDTLNQLYCEMDIAWPHEREPFAAHWAGHQFGQLHVSSIRAETHTVVRSPAMIRSDANQDFLLCMVADGYVEMTQEGRTAVLDHGSFGVLDCSKPFRYDCRSDFRQIVVRTPRELLTSRLPENIVNAAFARAIPGTSGVGKLVADLISGLTDLRDSVSPGAAVALSSSAVDMLAIAVTEVAPATTATAAAHARDLTAAQQALKRNLHDPEYSLTELSAELGMSVRYIQTLFARGGTTPRTWLQKMRVERARNHLLTSELTVAEVAALSGFRDVSNFSRTFRGFFGLSPGQYRSAQRAAYCPN